MAKCCTKKPGIQFRQLAKHRIDIQTPVETPNEYGSFDTAWITELTLWAIIEPKTGREFFQFGQLESQVKGRIIIRYQSVLKDTTSTAKRRIFFDDRYYEILSIRNFDETFKMEGNEYQELLINESNP